MNLTSKELASLPCIYDGSHCLVYRWNTNKYGAPVILKTLKQLRPTQEQVVRFGNEYVLTKNQTIPGIRKALEALQVDHRPALVLEYVEGDTLKNSCIKQPRSLAERLKVAISVAEALHALHTHDLIHKDLNSNNILVSPLSLHATVIDFGIAARLDPMGQRPKSSTTFEGTLPYTAPEQTGHVNHPLDQRADLYSLGVTLYELFTGQKPFQSDDTTELIHCHLAKIPAPLCQLNPEIPKVLSNIVLKLLEKTPENRYQSAFGVEADLARVLHDVETAGVVTDLVLAQHDFTGKLQPVQNLYGREEETRAILKSYHWVSQGPSETLLIEGPPGVGKTALASRAGTEITAKGGYFLTGDYDQYQRNIPYSGILQVIAGFVDRLLTETDVQLARWKTILQKAVGGNGRLLTSMVPSLELLLGSQPPLQELAPTEAQHRFQHVFQSFIRAIAQKEHPLVLWLDNLEWADVASLDLLAFLLTNVENRYLLFIGTYRQNEVGASHPLRATIKLLEENKAVVRALRLRNLAVEDLNALLAEVLHADESSVRPLTELVYAKTHGNALFTQDYLTVLATTGALVFDFAARKWTWDSDRIRTETVPESMAAFLSQNIEQLPESTREILMLAACVGKTFDLRTLTTLGEQPVRAAADALLAAADEGLIRPLDAGYKMLPALTEEKQVEVECQFEFAHNRFRQACYNLLPKKRRKTLMLALGRLRLKQLEPTAVAERSLELASLFNEGFQYVKDYGEKLRIAELNLMAGRIAKTATAYQNAIWYLSMAIGLLPPRRKWTDHYDLTFNLYLEAIEAEYLSTNFERAQQLSDEALYHARTVLDKTSIYQLCILFYTAQNKNPAAIDSALEALALAGIALPRESGELDKYICALRGELNASVQQIEELASLPVMQAEELLAVMRILMHAAAPAQQEQPELLTAIILTMVSLSVKHGNSPLSAFAYAWYGVLLGSSGGDTRRGYQIGRLAIDLSTQMDSAEVRAKVLFLFHACMRYWQEPIHKVRKPLEDVCRIGLETGDLEYAYYGAVHYCSYTLCLGNPLEKLYQRQARCIETLDKSRLRFHGLLARIWAQAVSNLLGGAADPGRLQGDLFDEEQMLAEWRQRNNVVLTFATYCCRTMLQYLFGQYEAAVESGRLGEAYAKGGESFFYLPLHQFYYALALLAHYPAVSAEKQAAYLRRAGRLQDALRQLAASAPTNFQHKVDLIEAEMARLRGDTLAAMECYGRAIRGARDHRYPHEEALAYECEAKFYLDLDRDDLAALCITNAWSGYHRWGATGKLNALERVHKHLLVRSGKAAAETESTHTTTSTSSTTGRASLALDTSAIVKAARILSQEVELPRMLEKVIHIVLESAGAERAVFVEQRNQQYLIQADGNVRRNHVDTMQAIPLEEAEDLPLAVLYYVARTCLPLVLHDAAQDRTYAMDRYIRARAPKSLLCLPVLHQDKLLGLLYMENSLIPGAFTAERLELLNVLTSQAAISMEIARHIERVGEQERLKREMELARRIQTAILPDRIEHPEFDIEAVMLAAEEVGGDYYDFLTAQDGTLWIAIGDVSSHGVTPGLIMMMAQTTHATLATQIDVTPEDVVRMLNSTLYRNVRGRLGEEHYMTFTTLKYLGDGRFQHAGAHLEMILHRVGRGACEVIETEGLWLNLVPDLSDTTRNSEFTMEPGDTLVLYTDGLTEARNRQHQLFEPSRMMEVVNVHAAKQPAALRDAIMHDVLAWCDHERNDDMSLVVVRRKNTKHEE